jgi:L-lactate utilization protein LutC
MSRDTFLARVRQSAQAGRAYRVELRELPQDVGYVGASGDLCSTMAAEVNAVGGTAHLVGDWEAARGMLAALLAEHQVRSALCWRHPVLDRLGLPSLLRDHEVAAYDYNQLASQPPEEQRRIMLSADLGISSADWAIAETGALVVCSRPGQERVATLLPPVHVAVIARNQIVPDLFDAFAKLPGTETGSLPSNVTFITGPSKTGDIELQLTTGVHGPGQWHVIVVPEDLEI